MPTIGRGSSLDWSIFNSFEMARHDWLFVYFESRRAKWRSLRRVVPADLCDYVRHLTPENRSTFYIFERDMNWCIACPDDSDMHGNYPVLLSGAKELFGVAST